MIEVKNQFARHLMLWVLTLPFLAVFLMPAMMEADRLQVPRTERQMLIDLGQDPAAVTARANAIFMRLFVETGAVEVSGKLFRAKDRGRIGQQNQLTTAKASNRYVDGFWNLLYRAIWRFMGLWPVLAVLLMAFAIPALMDGMVIRKSKVHRFQSHNPVFFWASSHAVITTSGAFMFLPFLPFAISLPVLYGAVALVSTGLWTTAANFQTGT